MHSNKKKKQAALLWDLSTAWNEPGINFQGLIMLQHAIRKETNIEQACKGKKNPNAPA